MTWTIRGKTVLVTGATSGIGLAASVELARQGARVVLVGRDPARTEAAVATVRDRSGVEPGSLLCDFSRQAAIRDLASTYRARYDRLDVLVNNAGGVNRSRRLTDDGIEATFAVNHLGYFLLTNLLLDLLVASAPARVVTVSSIAHRRATLDFDDLGFDRGGYSVMKAYGRSKLANILFANELARRLAGRGVTSNSLHPGAVDTNIWSSAPSWVRPVIWFLRRRFVSPEQGAETVVRLAASPDLDGVTGRYFEESRPVRPAPVVEDPAVAARLWEVSARMTGLAE